MTDLGGGRSDGNNNPSDISEKGPQGPQGPPPEPEPDYWVLCWRLVHTFSEKEKGRNMWQWVEFLRSDHKTRSYSELLVCLLSLSCPVRFMQQLCRLLFSKFSAVILTQLPSTPLTQPLARGHQTSGNIFFWQKMVTKWEECQCLLWNRNRRSGALSEACNHTFTKSAALIKYFCRDPGISAEEILQSLTGSVTVRLSCKDIGQYSESKL